jgi:Ser/Thr protein kinase RdoA (MazF antagonist)
MSSGPLDSAARQVLACYGLVSADTRPLGNHGGFSGARLWRVECSTGAFCLRAWPPGEPSPERLHWLHGLMAAARGAGLAFVPHVVPAGGATFVASTGHLWELCTWLPGRADFHERPTPARLRGACVALARLHHAWAAREPAEGPCPAVTRRLAQADRWLALTASGWRPQPDEADPVRPCAERAWRLLARLAGHLHPMLRVWVPRRYPLHPCLCDVWYDHVLFESDVVSGIIDYGSVKLDHPAADLARLLGSLVGDDTAGWDAGLDAYAAVRPLSADECSLARALDRTGVILAAANWLRWLYHDGRQFEDRPLVAARLAHIVLRLESWPI